MRIGVSEGRVKICKESISGKNEVKGVDRILLLGFVYVL